MRELDRRAIEECGIPSLLLMENAGRGVAELIFASYKGRRVSIFCGKGNNGGDGLVAARHLHNRGFQVQVFLFAEPSALKEDPALNYRIVSKMKIPLQVFAGKVSAAETASLLSRTDIVVDALLGVGLNAPVTGALAEAIDGMNQGAKNIVAVDIPSGLDADTGKVLGCAVKASITATLGLPKKGLFEGDGPVHSGKICVVDIGLPRELLQ